MKKILYYLLTTAGFALMFRATDTLSQKALFSQDAESLSKMGVDSSMLGNLGLSGMGLGNLGLGNLSINSLGIGNGKNVAGTCSDDKPLMLTDGECVSCDAVVKKKVDSDILMGCEKCPNLKKRGINCLFAMDEGASAQKEIAKAKKQKNEKTTKPEHKYSLVNIMGVDDKIQVTLINNETGQKNIVSVGDTFDGYTLKSISLDQGIIVEKAGVVEELDIGI